MNPNENMHIVSEEEAAKSQPIESHSTPGSIVAPENYHKLLENQVKAKLIDKKPSDGRSSFIVDIDRGILMEQVIQKLSKLEDDQAISDILEKLESKSFEDLESMYVEKDTSPIRSGKEEQQDSIAA